MQARLKRWVLSPDWNCCRLMVGERRCSGKEFHVLGAATRKLHLPNSVLVDGTDRSPRCAERSLTLPPTSVSGVQMPQKYEGQVSRTQSKASTATLNSIRCWIGSQWSVSHRTGVRWSYLPSPPTSRAATFITVCSCCIVVFAAPYKTALQ